jgi:hypothetical protein
VALGSQNHLQQRAYLYPDHGEDGISHYKIRDT